MTDTTVGYVDTVQNLTYSPTRRCSRQFDERAAVIAVIAKASDVTKDYNYFVFQPSNFLYTIDDDPYAVRPFRKEGGQ